MVGLESIGDKIRENRFTFKERPISALVRKSDLIHIDGRTRGGEKPKLTLVELGRIWKHAFDEGLGPR